MTFRTFATAAGLAALGIAANPTRADQIINDDLIVIGNVCAGFDCSNNQAFAADGIELKENNTRLYLGQGDFILAANQSYNGGANEFRIDTREAVSGSDATAVTVGGLILAPNATVMPDGTLRIDLSTHPNAIALSAPAINGPNATDTQVTVTDQYVYIPAGSFTVSGSLYSINPGVAVTSDAGTTFSYTGVSNVSLVSFAAGGNGVTLGRGSERVAGAVSVGAAGSERRVTEVADAVNDDDLINMGQLRAATAVADLSPMINAEAGRLEGVSAMTAAMSAIQPNPRARGPFAFSVGLGLYEGETALAAGMTWRANDNMLLKIGVADSKSSSPMTALSLNFAW